MNKPELKFPDKPIVPTRDATFDDSARNKCRDCDRPFNRRTPTQAVCAICAVAALERFLAEPEPPVSPLVDRIAKGHHVEFQSDQQTDKGPCCGTVSWVLDDIVCMHVSHEFIHMRQQDIELDHLTLHHRTGLPLWMLK